MVRFRQAGEKARKDGIIQKWGETPNLSFVAVIPAASIDTQGRAAATTRFLESLHGEAVGRAAKGGGPGFPIRISA